MGLADVTRLAYLIARYKMGLEEGREAYAEQQRKLLAEMQERERRQAEMDIQRQRLGLDLTRLQQDYWTELQRIQQQREAAQLSAQATQARAEESAKERKQALLGNILGTFWHLGKQAQEGRQVPISPQTLEQAGLDPWQPLEPQLQQMDMAKLTALATYLAPFAPPGTETTLGPPGARATLASPSELRQEQTEDLRLQNEWQRTYKGRLTEAQLKELSSRAELRAASALRLNRLLPLEVDQTLAEIALLGARRGLTEEQTNLTKYIREVLRPGELSLARERLGLDQQEYELALQRLGLDEERLRLERERQSFQEGYVKPGPYAPQAQPGQRIPTRAEYIRRYVEDRVRSLGVYAPDMVPRWEQEAGLMYDRYYGASGAGAGGGGPFLLPEDWPMYSRPPWEQRR